MKGLATVGWVAATVASVWISTAAVAAVRHEVTQPHVPIATSVVVSATQSGTVPGPSIDPSQGSAPASLEPTVAPTPTTSSSSQAPSTTAATTTTSTSAAPSTTSPTTSAPPSTTAAPTTTSVPPPTTTAPPEVQTHQMIGGWVRIVVGAGTVDLDAAAPAVGFTMEITDSGPDKVEVRFRSDEHESRLKADWEAGEFRLDIDEKD